MRRLLAILLALALILSLTGCGLLPDQTDAADEAVLRLMTLSREGDELTIYAMTPKIEAGNTSIPAERLEGYGEDYRSARADMEERRQSTPTHTTNWVVEENALADALEAFLVDPELTYATKVYLLGEQSTEEFLDSFELEKVCPAMAMDRLSGAQKDKSVSMLELSSALAAGESVRLPVVYAKDNEVFIVDEVEVREWK